MTETQSLQLDKISYVEVLWAANKLNEKKKNTHAFLKTTTKTRNVVKTIFPLSAKQYKSFSFIILF